MIYFVSISPHIERSMEQIFFFFMMWLFTYSYSMLSKQKFSFVISIFIFPRTKDVIYDVTLKQHIQADQHFSDRFFLFFFR